VEDLVWNGWGNILVSKRKKEIKMTTVLGPSRTNTHHKTLIDMQDHTPWIEVTLMLPPYEVKVLSLVRPFPMGRQKIPHTVDGLVALVDGHWWYPTRVEIEEPTVFRLIPLSVQVAE
jgi:hypothetical protein